MPSREAGVWFQLNCNEGFELTSENQTVQAEKQRVVLRTALICLAMLLVGVLILYLIFSTEPTARRDSAVRQTASLVDVTRGEFGTFRPIVEAMGTVRAAREITLSARVEGEVLELGQDFVPGGLVEAGELLVRIDDADYQVAAEQRRTALDMALAELEIERGERAAAATDYRQFNRELPPERRALVLREPQWQAAQAQVRSARADLRQAELDLERTRLEAPFDAHVISREVNIGSIVGPGAALGRLVGIDNYWVEATVPVTRLPWLLLPDGGRQGARVELRNDKSWLSGQVREGELFRLIGQLDGDTRLARVLIAVDDPLARQSGQPLPRLLLGEYLTVRIEGRAIENVVRLERDYIRANDTVWLMVEGRLVIQPVSIVFEDERYAYIDQGLSDDDRVVITRLATVQDGLRLRLDDGGDDIGEGSAP